MSVEFCVSMIPIAVTCRRFSKLTNN